MSTHAKPFRAAGVEDLKVKRVAVIGAGSMGAGIAAQFANAGVPVDLLDLPGKDGESRNAPAEGGIARQLKVHGFMVPDAAALVTPGNTEDDLGRLAEADWIVEAVIENVEIKRALYTRVDAVRKPGSIVSSNTSTIPRADLVEGASPDFARDFVITHFFNPPRIMRLVELVTTDDTPAEIRDAAAAACETALGKTVVDCRDTPGFIANRIGCFWMAVAVKAALDAGLTVEEADAVNAALGIPRTGAFGLLDLVGIDLVRHVWGSLMQALPADDRLHAYDLPGEPVIKGLIDAGRFGRKAKAGFYRMAADKSLEALDLASGDYRPAQPVSPKALPGGGRDLAALLSADDKYGTYAWRVLSEVLLYSCAHGPDIAADVGAIDTAIALGYAWKEGPFRLADHYGLATIAQRLENDGADLPPLLAAAIEAGGFYAADDRPLGTDGTRAPVSEASELASLAPVKAKGAPLASNDAASLWDLGDGIACFEMHTKMNSFAPGVFDVLEETLERGGRDFAGLVLGNDAARAFSVGADLTFFSALIEKQAWEELDAYIARGQKLFLALKYAGFPVVAAAHGLALGGGCEFMLHAGTIVAHAELNAGLPEPKVGIVPGWGGCTQLLVNAQANRSGPQGPAALSSTVFNTIFAGAPSTSARDAIAKGILRPGDTVVMNRDRLLATAKNVPRRMVDTGYTAPERVSLTLGGPSAKAGIMNLVNGLRASGALTDTDVNVASILADVLTGGPDADPTVPVTEPDIMTLERQAVLELAKSDKTQERIQHMLKTGKPLRN